MKAITIHQPWATLIALGEKQYETRGWSTKHRGLIAIHAAKQVDKEACMQEPIKSILSQHGLTADNLPTGSVVAIAKLSECWSIGTDYRSGGSLLFNSTCGTDKPVSAKEERVGFYYSGRYAWEMTEVKPIKPVLAKGQQGLWNWSGEFGR